MNGEIQSIADFLLAKPEISLALIFGSFASGKFRPDSDIDIAIAGSTRMSEQELRTLLNEMACLNDRKIDLIDLHNAHAPLIQEIFHNPIWIKKDGDIYYKILRRSIYEAEDFLPVKNKILEARIKRFIK